MGSSEGLWEHFYPRRWRGTPNLDSRIEKTARRPRAPEGMALTVTNGTFSLLIIQVEVMSTHHDCHSACKPEKIRPSSLIDGQN